MHCKASRERCGRLADVARVAAELAISVWAFERIDNISGLQSWLFDFLIPHYKAARLLAFVIDDKVQFSIWVGCGDIFADYVFDGSLICFVGCAHLVLILQFVSHSVVALCLAFSEMRV